MTDKITEPMPPSTLDPEPHPVLAGDWTDDDAQVYDEEFESADHGPVKWDGVPHQVPATKVATRLITRTVRVGTVGGVATDPTLLLTADVNRKNLTVFLRGQPGTSTLRIAGEKSLCYNDDTSLTLYAPASAVASTVILDGHTGPVWVHAEDDTNYVQVGIVAVSC